MLDGIGLTEAPRLIDNMPLLPPDPETSLPAGNGMAIINQDAYALSQEDGQGQAVHLGHAKIVQIETSYGGLGTTTARFTVQVSISPQAMNETLPILQDAVRAMMGIEAIPHRGRQPSQPIESSLPEETLKRMLGAAVEMEDYECADRIRRQIEIIDSPDD